MNIIHETYEFSEWLKKLKDIKGRARIVARIDSIKLGNFGDHKSVGDEVSELRIHFGAGYRVYYGKEGQNIYLLILGGDKSSQERDIVKAKKIWRVILDNKKQKKI